MQLHYNLDSFPLLKKSIVTIGSFDGVHLGHKMILSRLIEMSKLMSAESILITFWPHPKSVIKKDTSISLLNTLEEKISLLSAYSIDHLIILNFNEALSLLSADSFIQEVLIEKLQTSHFILGYDHRFGNNREGSLEYLKQHQDKFSIEPIEIPKQELDSLTISSTQIRKALLDGHIKLANDILGYPYLLSGKVIGGKELGRTIGYPTANIFIEEPFKLIPKIGVYAVYVYVKNLRLRGMMNIGYQPTVDGETLRIEVHIFDFNQDIYLETIRVECMEYVRPELKFSSVDALIKQLQQDEKSIREKLSH
jgi:riboflavin kinase/FMN adenylyltransferase